MKGYGFKGVDIDFEDPSISSSGFTSFVKTLHSDIQNYCSTCYIEVDTADYLSTYGGGYLNPVAVAPYVKYYNIMNYDNGYVSESLANHNSAYTGSAQTLDSEFQQAVSTYGDQVCDGYGFGNGDPTQLSSYITLDAQHGIGICVWDDEYMTSGAYTMLENLKSEYN
jgi:GH18 family chitinase